MNKCIKRSGQYLFCIPSGFKQKYKPLQILMNVTMSKVAFLDFPVSGIISQTYLYHLVVLVIVLVCNTAIPGITSQKWHNEKVKLSGKV